jgi:hypothetical protein
LIKDENEIVSDLWYSKLLDNYLEVVALDLNLLPSKFISLAELLPDHARIVSDRLYRAVDNIFFLRSDNSNSIKSNEIEILNQISICWTISNTNIIENFHFQFRAEKTTRMR